MKKNYVLILLGVLLCTSGITQLSGTYTIDGSSPTSGTNYNSFGDAVSALNTSGVSGAVTFNVATGSYWGEVLIGSITGVSATNTITFDGGTSGAIMNDSLSTSSTGTIRFLGASYITFSHLTITNTGYGRTVYFDGSNDHITFKNCDLSTQIGTASAYSVFYNESGAANLTNFLTIDSNVISNGYYGAGYFYGGSTTTWEQGFVFTNNLVKDFYYYGMYVYYQENSIISNNKFIQDPTTSTSTAYGPYFRMKSSEVSNNEITLYGTSTNYGLTPYYCDGTAISPTIVSNNMITTSTGNSNTLYGMRVYNCKYTDVVYNSVRTGSTTGTTYGLYHYGTSTYGPVNIQNNIFYTEGGGSTNYVGYYGSSSTSVVAINNLDNNIYYTTDTSTTTDFFYWGSGNIDLSALQTASSKEANSLWGDPLFLSSTNLHVQGTLANNVGSPIAGVTIDFDGDTRNATTPDIGADEFTPPTCPSSTGLSAFNQTGTTYDITWIPGAADVSWILEYGPLGFTPGTGTSMASANDTATITGLTPKTDYDVYIRGFCSAGDTSIYAGPLYIRTGCLSTLSGTYTLNPSAPASLTNYTTMADWFQDLFDCGVGGQTVLNIAPGSGPYVMGIDLSGINGLSSTNTVTMNGNGVTVNRGGNSSFITLDGITHFTITNFNFVNETPNTEMFGIMMRNGCDSITIKNNTIDVGTGYTTSLSCGIASSNLLTSASSNGNNANNTTIDSNIIIGGYYGIRLNGVSSTVSASGNKITNNTIQDAYVYSMYNYYQDNLIISNNDISRPTRTTISTFYGVHVDYSTKTMIANNKIHDAGSGSYTCYPIYLGNSYNTVGNETEIVNNAIYNNGTTGTYYGIYLYSYSSTTGKNTNINIWHNTVDINTNGSSGARRGLSTASTTATYIDSVDITNNIFNIYGNGTGTKHAIYLPSFTSLTGSNNLIRNVATAGTNNLGYFGSNIATLAAWNTATGMTGNVNANPIIIAPGYKPYSNLIDNLGTPLASVTTDIDGVTRTVTPDLGAVEFIPTGGDLTLINGRLAQVDDCYGIADSAFISIRNLFGSTVDFSVNPVTIYLNITGPVNTVDSIVLNTDTIAVNQTIDLTYSNVDMSIPGKYTFNAYINFALFNILDINDTINLIDASEVKPIIAVNPTFDTLYSFLDSSKLSTQSPFYPGGAFFFTEVCHYKITTGAPTSWPTYLTADDYLEITGVPNSDLAGYTLEQWGTSSMNGSVTFPSGTVLSSNGTAIIMLGQSASASQPANFYYDGRGGSTTTYSSSTPAGRILKDANGNIVDAHGYNGYNFPAAANVTPSDWSAPLSGGGSTSGQRLLGPDLNSGSGWVVSSATNRQDPNTVNPGVTIPAPTSVSGLTWTDLTNMTVIDTTPEIYVKGIFTANGTYPIEAAFITPCGTYRDTAYISIYNQTYDTTIINSCDSFVMPLSGRVQYATGFFVDTLLSTTTIPTYDSIFFVYDVNIDTTNETITLVECDSFVSPSGKVWDTTGTYLDTITNSLGCDSLMVFNLTVNFASSSVITTTECDTFIAPSGNVFRNTGVFMDTIMNTTGCDSVITINLTILNSTTSSRSVTVCDTYTAPTGAIYTTTGIYNDTIANSIGCDSVIVINLTVNNSVSRTDNIALCIGGTHRVGPNVYSTAGTYTDVFQTNKGCDSTIITNLSYFAAATASVNYNFCIGDSVQILGNWYYAATTFNDTVVAGSSNGCDSVTTHNITTRTVNPALDLGNDVFACLDGGVTIFASNNYDSYSWNTGGTTNVLSVTGANSGVGTTDYILTVTQASSGCSAVDTVNITFSNCTGLGEMDADLNVNLYPNPASDFITIEITDKLNQGNLKLEILNSIGQVVTSKTIENTNEKVIMDVNNFSKGLYLVRVSSDRIYMTKKLIIQK